jgi:hypothetical protein
VTLCKDGLPDRTVGLVSKRTRGTEPTYSYYILKINTINRQALANQC